jgi:hypothetical protein
VVEHVGGDHAALVVVVAGGQVALQAGFQGQVGAPEPVHGQHQLELLGVDLDHAYVGGDAQQEHHR